MLIEDCGGIGTFHESASIAASKLHRKVVGVSVSEYNTNLHAWLSSQFGVVDSWAGHCTWKRYKFRPYEVDIYGAGFPCQPFSRLGTMLGTKDPRFDFVVEQIHAVFGELKPKSALLENTEDFEQVWNQIIKPIIESYGYLTIYCVLNSDLWVPQNRNRFYAVVLAPQYAPGIAGKDMYALLPSQPYVCPAESFRQWLKRTRLTWISVSDASKNNRGLVFQRNLKHVLSVGISKVRQSDARPAYVCCDMNASESRQYCVLDQIPCVTKTRGESSRLWLFLCPGHTFTHRARLDVVAFGSLQGWSCHRIAALNAAVSNRQLAGAFGNGMTVPVLVEFLVRLLRRFPS